MTVLVVENTLYDTDASKQQWLNDPQAVADAFIFNFIGILGLYKISSKRGRMKTYPKENTNVRINTIDAEDNDMANVIKFMSELGGITNETANQMTRLLAKLRQGNVDIQDQPIRDLIAQVKISKTKPSPKLRVIYNAFAEGNITLEQVAKAIQPFVRQKEFKVRSGEFKELAKSYRPILKNDIPEPNFTAAASAATATDGPQQQAKQEKTKDAKDVKPSQSPETQKQDFSKASEPMQFFNTTKNMYRKNIRDYAKTVGLTKVADIEEIVRKKLINEFRDSTNEKIYPLPAEWGEKLGSFQEKNEFRRTILNNVKHHILIGSEPKPELAAELPENMPKTSGPHSRNDFTLNESEIDYYAKNVQSAEGLARVAHWFSLLRSNRIFPQMRPSFIEVGRNIMEKNPYHFLKQSKDLFDSSDIVRQRASHEFHGIAVTRIMGYSQALNKIVENGEFDDSTQTIKLPLIVFTEVMEKLDKLSSSVDATGVRNRLQQKKVEGNTLYQFSQSTGGASNPLTFNFNYDDATRSIMSRQATDNIDGTIRILKLARESDPDLSLHVSDLAHANGVDPENPGKDEDTAKFFIKTLAFFFLFSRQQSVPSHIYDELTEFANKIDFTNTGVRLVFPMLTRFRVTLLTSDKFTPLNFMDQTQFEKMIMDEVEKAQTDEFFGMKSRYDISQFIETFFRSLDDGQRIAQDFFDRLNNKNVPLMAMMYGHNPDDRMRNRLSGDLVGFNLNLLPIDKKIEYTKSVVRHIMTSLGEYNGQSPLKRLLKYEIDAARARKINAYQEIIMPIAKEMFGEDKIQALLKDPIRAQSINMRQMDAMVADIVEKKGNAGAQEILAAWHEKLKTGQGGEGFYPSSAEYLIRAMTKNMKSPSREDYEAIVEYLDAIDENIQGGYRDYKKKLMHSVPPEVFIQTDRTHELVDLANEDVDRAARQERFFGEDKNFLIELAHSLGSLDKESARTIMNKMAETSTKSRKRDYRSDAINLLGKMFFSARESGYLDVLDEAHENIKGKNKEHVENRLLSGMVVSKIKPAIMGDDTPIKPQLDLNDDGIMKLLDYNNINIKEVMGGVNLKRKKLSEKINTVDSTSSVDFQNLAIEADDEIEDLARWSAEYYTLYQARNHGRIAADFKRAFKVNIQKQVDGVKAFKEKYPDSEIVQPSFHGTGSVAASMILRFGFATVSERDRGPIQVTGKMLGEGIYVTDKIDKALQYVGDSGYTRGLGTSGYILECETVLGEKGVTYQGAGTGGDRIRSPEWAVRLPNQQVRIVRAYEVEIVDEGTMQERVKSYGLVNEDRSLNTSNFKYFLTEAKKQRKNMVTNIFYDGLIPLPDGSVVEYDDLDRSKLKNDVIVEPSAKGPVIAYPGGEGIYHIDNTADFIRRTRDFKAFKKNVFK